MNKSNDINHFEKTTALSAAMLGFEFEFYSNLTRGRTAESISKIVGKKVTVTNKYHSNIPVDRSSFKLEPDYSGGNNMVELVTGPMEYTESIPVLIKILKWIDQNGWTDDRCAFQFSVSFAKERRDVKQPINQLDKLKFILGIDENFIYSKFENRAKNVYTKSIKRVVPMNRYMILENISSVDPKMYKVPGDKYYGANFEKLSKGYLEFRYLGGKDYQKKITEIREVIDYVVLYLYDILSNRTTGYSKEDLEKLKSMMKEYGKIARCFSNPDLFLRYYPDFHIFIDLKGFDENLKTYFPMVRDKVFDLVIEGGVTDCYFNYDTATGSFQVKDARIRNAMEISNLDMVSCDVKSATLKNCNIYDSKIKKCILDECYLVRSTEVMDSKFNNSRAESTNELKDCYIDCNDKSVNCKIEGGVFASGVLGDFSEVSKETKRAKNWNVIRGERFVTDKRLKNLNFEYPNMKFGNMNY
jgi:hypothetical protein